MPVSSSTNSRVFNSPKNTAFALSCMTLYFAFCATLCTTLAACKGNEPEVQQGPTAQDIEERLKRISEAAIVAKQSASVPVIAWESLAALLPDSLGKVTATAPASGHYDADGTRLSKTTRSYALDDAKIEIDLMDSVRASGVMLAFALQQAAAQRQTAAQKQPTAETNVIAANVATYPALVRMNTTTQEATVTLALAHRFLIEVRVAPTDSAQTALLIANALPLATIVGLIPPDAEDDRQATQPTTQPTTAPDDEDDPDGP